jgi:lysylphosphatidylglycerol synthetase-like protein (DUF2156 family)
MAQSQEVPMADRPDQSSKLTAATVIVAVQAGLLALSGLVVWAVSAARRRRFVHRFWYHRVVQHPGLAGVVFLLAAAGLVILAAGISRRRTWAPMTAYVAEGVLLVGSVLRARPFRTVVGIALAVLVIVFVATERRRFEPTSTT